MLFMIFELNLSVLDLGFGLVFISFAFVLLGEGVNDSKPKGSNQRNTIAHLYKKPIFHFKQFLALFLKNKKLSHPSKLQRELK